MTIERQPTPDQDGQVEENRIGKQPGQVAEAVGPALGRTVLDSTAAETRPGPKRRPAPENRAKPSAANKGRARSAETRAKISAANKGRTLSPEHRAKLSAANKGENNPNYGKSHSTETRAKISAVKKGTTHSAETRAKISAANMGRTQSAETRAKISAALTGRALSPEHRARAGAAKKGTTHSAETRAKMSAAKKGNKPSEETKAKISAALTGSNHPMYGREHSPQTKEKIRQGNLGKVVSEAAKEQIRQANLGKEISEATRARISASKTGERHPNWDNNIDDIKEAIKLHAGGLTMRQASLQLGYSPGWLTGWKGRQPERFQDLLLMALSEEISAPQAAELELARSIYDRLGYGSDDKELLALHYGFGIYRRHSYGQIAAICGQDQAWVRQRLGRIMSGQSSPARCLRFELDDDSRQPAFRHDSQLTVRQLHRLADILPRLDRLGIEVAARLYGLGGRQRQGVDEINRGLFQSTPAGKSKIIGLKRELDRQLMSV